MKAALPDAPEATQALAGDLIVTTLSAVGKNFSQIPKTSLEIDFFADAIADMFCAYLNSLARV